MGSFLQDVRYALRLMAKNPGFTLVAVLTLALGIGANTAIFSVVDAALLRGLPYPHPERLVAVSMTKQGQFGEMEASYPNYLDWREQNTVFEQLAGHNNNRVVFRTPKGSIFLPAAEVSANFFDALGTQAVVGRTFRPGEDAAQASRTVVLSYPFWQQRFGGSPEALGQTLELDDELYTVIGVLPRAFQFAPVGAAQVFIPVPSQGQKITRRNLHWFNVVGRLKPGVSLAEARAEMETISARLAQAYPEANADTGVRLVSLRETILGKVEPVFLVLLGAVGVVLLIACVNLANLLLARSAGRQREVGVRIAVGAGRMRIIRQLLTESIVLALAGAGAGLLLAYWGTEALIGAIPPQVLDSMPYVRDSGLDLRVLGFTTVVALATGVVFGLAPALQLSARTPQDAMQESSSRSATGRGGKLRDALVMGEIALALALLVGAGLLLKSLERMLEADPGFRTDHLVTAGIIYPERKLNTPELADSLDRQMHERLRNLPGVRSVAFANILPFSGQGNTIRFQVEGETLRAAGDQPEAHVRSVSPGYFQTLGAKLLRGRWFDEQDRPDDAPPVLVVNRTLARSFLGGEDAVGRRLRPTYAPGLPYYQVVGVVDDIQEVALDAAPRPAIYAPVGIGGTYRNFVLRTSSDPAVTMAGVRRAFSEVEPEAVVIEVTTMRDTVLDSPATFLREYPATLTAVFAAVALLLAVVGVYGVVSYSVAQRTREIAVRMALGAEHGQVLRLVLAGAGRLVLLGLSVGVVAALAGSRLIANLLFGVQPFDVPTFVVVAALLGAVTLLASYVPARRAMKVDPMVALRYE